MGDIVRKWGRSDEGGVDSSEVYMILSCRNGYECEHKSFKGDIKQNVPSRLRLTANPCLSRGSTPPSVSSDNDFPHSISTHDETIIDQQLQDMKVKPQLF